MIPDTQPFNDIVRRIIEAGAAYQFLNGLPPTCIHVNGPFLEALANRGFQAGTEVAGMKILASPESVADQAICSRDVDLFKVFPAKPARRKAKIA